MRQENPRPVQAFFRLGGRVLGADGTPVSGLPIHYSIDRRKHSIETNALGEYRFSAPQGARVILSPRDGPGGFIPPSRYTIDGLSGNHLGLHFSLNTAPPEGADPDPKPAPTPE